MYPMDRTERELTYAGMRRLNSFSVDKYNLYLIIIKCKFTNESDDEEDKGSDGHPLTTTPDSKDAICMKMFTNQR